MFTTCTPLTNDNAISNDPRELLENVEAKLQAFVYRRRVSLEEKFSDFDRQKRRKITPDQFMRALCSVGAVLAPREVKAIVDRYAIVEQKQRLVNYHDFLESINEVFAPSITCRQPDFAVKDSLAFIQEVDLKQRNIIKHRILQDAENRDELTKEEEEKLEAALEKLRIGVARRRLGLKDYLRDHDKLNRGQITKDQFRRTLSTLGWNLPDDLMLLLEHKFCSLTDPTHINYREFLSEVDPPNDLIRPTDLTWRIADVLAGQSQKITGAELQLYKPTLRKLMKHMQTVVKRNEIHVESAMQDFDQLRHGGVFPNRFRAVLNSVARFRLSDDELRMIHSAFPFANDPDQIDYKAFCLELNAVFTHPKIVTDPTQELDNFEVYNADEDDESDEDDDASHQELKDRQEAAVEAVIEHLRDTVRKRGIDHKPFFQSFDKHRMGIVTRTRFASVLHTLGLDVTQQELELLFKKFRKGTDVKYLPFCILLDQRAN